MALAPRIDRSESDRGGKRSSVASSAGKAAQRARNGGSKVTGTNSGSSGAGLAVRRMKGLDWEEIEDQAEHLCDIAAKISHTQVGASGTVTATINVPISYLHALQDAHIASLGAMVYLRVHHVPIDRFLEAEDDDEEGEDG